MAPWERVERLASQLLRSRDGEGPSAAPLDASLLANAWPTSSDCTTEGVRVESGSRYVAKQSAPEQRRWQWAYNVRIVNDSERIVQLLTRHWIVTDGEGRQAEVGQRSQGVVGAQPILEPGQSFEYTSGCPLTTTCGTMHGFFEMAVLVPAATPHGEPELQPRERFEVAVERFGLTMDGSDALIPVVLEGASEADEI